MAKEQVVATPKREVTITKKAGTHQATSANVAKNRNATGRHQYKAPDNPAAKKNDATEEKG